MSDNKYNKTRPSKHIKIHIPKLSIADRNFATAAKSALQQKFSPAPRSSREVLEAKAKTLAMTVHQHILPIVQAGGALDQKGGLEALEATIFTMFLQGFDSTMFSKEELIHLCALLHAQAMRASIEADPAGKGRPDIMSGQDTTNPSPFK